MQRLLYSLAVTLALPFALLRLLIRSLKAPAYRQRIGERLALRLPAPATSARQIWIHAVSVGEVAAAEPLLHRILNEIPDAHVLITTTTPTGSQRVRSLMENLDKNRISHCYLPYDLPYLLRPFIGRVKPALLIIMETELWPNLIHCCKAQGVRLLLANARLSGKSARGYARIGGLTRTMLRAFDKIAAQSEADAQRLQTLGARADAIEVTGSLKFHQAPNAQDSIEPALFASIKASGRPVLVAASTRAGEEQKVLDAFGQIQAQIRDALLVLVPRHPERFNDVADLLRAREFTMQRRSEARQLSADTEVLLGDSMGELTAYYQCADVAFVGGSLVPTGCQNVLEPAALGLPVITGPSQFNFATICAQLEAAGALSTVADVDGLVQQGLVLLRDREKAQAMGRAGQALVADNQNALPAHLAIVKHLLD